ncbi:MAG TPA: aminotransferase class I/II-fold pyridoxal phosphate-dependent enzyme, partial [Casimicrobiaceae bacterium]|nr:aminotransferase class I/II-fold pyridoxal phosphate-dependent enzyme [Casimicrobiaceae bacterium]
MSDPAIGELASALAQRESEGLARTRRRVEGPQGPRLRIDGRTLLAFASNDYLGLASDPAIVDAVCDAARRWGVGSGASHLVVGHSAAHDALERELAAFVAPCDGARALLFSSGYLANLAILTALASRNDAIFTDRLNHACLNDGALLSRARV